MWESATNADNDRTEQFIKSVQHEKDEEERQRAIEINKRKVRGPLDPLVETLVEDILSHGMLRSERNTCC